MKLRTVTWLIVTASAVALLGGLFIGYTSWADIQRGTVRADEVGQLHNEYQRIRLALEDAVLVERTPDAITPVLAKLRSLVDPSRSGFHFNTDIEDLMQSLISAVEGIQQDLQNNPAATMQTSLELLVDERVIRRLDAELQSNLLASEQAAMQTFQDNFRQDLSRLVLAVIALGLLMLINAVVIFKRTRGPLDTLMSGIHQIGKTDSPSPELIELSTRDEFGLLAQAINSMNGRLFEQRNELLESQTRFDELAETIDDLFWIFDVENNQALYLSPAFEQLYGFNPDPADLNPAYWEAHIPEKDIPAYRDYIQGWSKGNSEGKYRFTRPDGETIWVQDKAYGVHDADGTLVRMVGIARNITAQVEAIEALEQRDRQQAIVYELAHEISNSREDLVAICERLVYRLPELLDKHSDGAARITLMNDRFQTDNWEHVEQSIEFPIVIQGAEEGVVELGLQEMDTEHDTAFFSSEVESLELVATQLTTLLHNRRIESRLWQDEKLKAVGELTGGVAHDFNNLLTVILGNAEMIRDDMGEQDPNLDLIEMILQASSHAADLTARLLAFARRQPLNPETVELNALIEEMAPIIRRTLGETIDVNIKLEPNLWASRIDRTQLSAALLNLCINGRDAMTDGGSLFIETVNQTVSEEEADEFLDLASGDYAVISVTDDGEGIPDDVLQHVFEPFYTTKPKAAGTGLGLSMVYGFTKQSGGNVTIYSEPEKGTTLRLYLPRTEQSGDVQTAGDPGEFIAEGMRCLLVEDDALVRSYTERLLKRMGFEVISAKDADQALEIYSRESEFDLLLTDVVMPGSMDGIALGDCVRQQNKRILILYMSGYTRDRFSKKKELEPDAILLNKPFRRGELVSALQQVWSNQRPTLSADR